MAERKIIVIPAKNDVLKEHDAERQLKVCTYARVSTDTDEQQNSVESQKAYYTDLIHSTPKWKFVKCYADEGISGASAKKRPAFMEMIKDCKKGKIDLIITKSISRFSRNLMDTLKYIQELKALGVGIIFHSENIDTRNEYNEMVLTLLASIAQQDIINLSNNVKKGLQMAREQGKIKFPFGRIYGYERGEEDEPKIIPHEAEIIKLIYEKYLMGDSIVGITKFLNDEYKAKYGKNFGPSTVSSILKNEVFCGDLILQKTFIDSPITKKVIVNNGQLPKVYIKDNHEGIVSRELFEKVQMERAKRNNKQYVSPINQMPQVLKFSSIHALSSLLVCGDCGSEFRRKTWTKRSGENVKMWICQTKTNAGTKYCPDSPNLVEEQLEDAILKSIVSTQEERQILIDKLTYEVEHTTLEIMRYANDKINIEELNKEIEITQQKIMAVINNDSYIENIETDDIKINKMSEEIKRLRKIIESYSNKVDEDMVSNQIKEISDKLEDEFNITKSYSNELTMQLIHTIKVIDKNTIQIFYNCGLVDTQVLNNKKTKSYKAS